MAAADARGFPLWVPGRKPTASPLRWLFLAARGRAPDVFDWLVTGQGRPLAWAF
jgi:hypothetical protein